MSRNEWRDLYRAWRIRAKECLAHENTSQWAWDLIWHADTRSGLACRYAREAREDQFRRHPLCAIDLMFGPITISGPRHQLS